MPRLQNRRIYRLLTAALNGSEENSAGQIAAGIMANHRRSVEDTELHLQQYQEALRRRRVELERIDPPEGVP